MAERWTQLKATIFLRKMVDAALADAPEDIGRRVMETLGEPRTPDLAIRIVRAISGAGYCLGSTRAWKRVDGIRRRMELEDLVAMALYAAARRDLGNMLVNEQARDAVTRGIWETLRRNNVVLRPTGRG